MVTISSCLVCGHRDGSLIHRHKETEQIRTGIRLKCGSTTAGFSLGKRQSLSPLLVLSSKLLLLSSLIISFCLQGRGASRCLHLPGPDGFQPQRERALPSPGAPAGGSLLRRRTHPEVASTHRHATPPTTHSTFWLCGGSGGPRRLLSPASCGVFSAPRVKSATT